MEFSYFRILFDGFQTTGCTWWKMCLSLQTSRLSFVVYHIGYADAVISFSLVAHSVFCFRSIMWSGTWIKSVFDVVLWDQCTLIYYQSILKSFLLKTVLWHVPCHLWARLLSSKLVDILNIWMFKQPAILSFAGYMVTDVKYAQVVFSRVYFENFNENVITCCTLSPFWNWIPD